MEDRVDEEFFKCEQEEEEKKKIEPEDGDGDDDDKEMGKSEDIDMFINRP